jgi:hypothetical protein
MPLPPALTPDERRAALEKAATARKVRAQVKEELKTSALTLPELFDRAASDDILGKLKVVSMLESMPNTGKVAAAWCSRATSTPGSSRRASMRCTSVPASRSSTPLAERGVLRSPFAAAVSEATSQKAEAGCTVKPDTRTVWMSAGTTGQTSRSGTL